MLICISTFHMSQLGLYNGGNLGLVSHIMQMQRLFELTIDGIDLSLLFVCPDDVDAVTLPTIFR